MTLSAIFIVLFFLYRLASARLEKMVFTAPILFTVAGIVALFLLPELRDRETKTVLLSFLPTAPVPCPVSAFMPLKSPRWMPVCRSFRLAGLVIQTRANRG
jgi:hypothetical protein